MLARAQLAEFYVACEIGTARSREESRGSATAASVALVNVTSAGAIDLAVAIYGRQRDPNIEISLHVPAVYACICIRPRKNARSVPVRQFASDAAYLIRHACNVDLCELQDGCIYALQ